MRRTSCSFSAHARGLAAPTPTFSKAVVAACVLGLVGCADAERSAASEREARSEAIAHFIVHGKPSAPCGWPSAVKLPERGCSGALIHPRVIVTAGYCMVVPGHAVVFGEDSHEITALVDRCNYATTHDSGYCILDRDITDVPIVPPLVGCERERFLKAGTMVHVVGFGSKTPDSGEYGTKREVEVPITEVAPDAVVLGLLDGTGPCHGDTGGPAFIHLVDGERDYGWRLVGTATGPSQSGCNCSCRAIYTSVSWAAETVEAIEHIDVSPCTDSAGQFDPGPSCRNMPSRPETAGGHWPRCNNPTANPIETCGPNPDGGPAPDAPFLDAQADREDGSTEAAGGVGGAPPDGFGGKNGGRGGSGNDAGVDDNGKGCGCRTSSNRPHSPLAPMVLAIAAAPLLRRRIGRKR